MLSILDVTQVAEALQCEPARAEQALRTGDLPGLQYGRSWIVPESALAARLHEKALEEAERRRGAGDKPRPRAVLREVKRKAPPELP